MTWHEALARARIGIPVRRAAWAADLSRRDHRLLCVPGLGTTPAVAIIRTPSADTIVTPSLLSAADFHATDWEHAAT